jgi:hypothetical protein
MADSTSINHVLNLGVYVELHQLGDLLKLGL